MRIDYTLCNCRTSLKIFLFVLFFHWRDIEFLFKFFNKKKNLKILCCLRFISIEIENTDKKEVIFLF